MLTYVNFPCLFFHLYRSLFLLSFLHWLSWYTSMVGFPLFSSFTTSCLLGPQVVGHTMSSLAYGTYMDYCQWTHGSGVQSITAGRVHPLSSHEDLSLPFHIIWCLSHFLVMLVLLSYLWQGFRFDGKVVLFIYCGFSWVLTHSGHSANFECEGRGF